MRAIPVIDLRHGVAVHAVRGQRDQYQPVDSLLSSSSHPIDLARAFRSRLGLSELYLADLDAILNTGHHRELITELARQEGFDLLVDCGTNTAAAAGGVLAAGAQKVIIGAETLVSLAELEAIQTAIPAARRVFSLDMRAGRLISQCPELAGLQPLDLVERLADSWSEVLLLDLARIGSGQGIDEDLVQEVRRRYPTLSVLCGGGIRDANDLHRLRQVGVGGVLLGTTLHRGVIQRADLERLELQSPGA